MSILNMLEKARDRAFQAADHDAIEEARQLISAIHGLLDGKEWNPQTTNDIADLIGEAGLEVNACYDEDED